MTLNLQTPDGRPAAEPITVTRRTFGILAAAGAYCASIRPVNAQAITTPDAGLVIEDVSFKSFDGVDLPAYYARPEGTGPFPTVIVVNEIFGIHAYIADICRRFANAGYAALAPAYFHRAGDPSTLDWQIEDQRREVFRIVRATAHDQVMQDSDAAVAFLDGRDEADSGRLGITGFCWGGRVTWTYAARNPAVKAGVAWYGRLKAPEGDDETYPIQVADKINGRVLGLYGGQDRGIPNEDVAAMRAALRAAGDDTADIILYENAQHGFHADYRPSYDADAAKDGWARLMAWFEARGVA